MRVIWGTKHVPRSVGLAHTTGDGAAVVLHTSQATAAYKALTLNTADVRKKSTSLLFYSTEASLTALAW